MLLHLHVNNLIAEKMICSWNAVNNIEKLVNTPHSAHEAHKYTIYPITGSECHALNTLIFVKFEFNIPYSTCMKVVQYVIKHDEERNQG